jgi:F-type H+-transporting ATPase subunit b
LKKIIRNALFAAALSLIPQAQLPAAQAQGGAEAVHPGGAVEPGSHAQAAAKEGEGHAQQPMANEVWWKLANFAILVAALGWLISKNAGPFFRSRTASIQIGIEEATRTREDAMARAAEIEAKVANLLSEVEHLRQQSQQELSREGERVSVETEAQIRKIQAQAEAEIASAAKHARQELKAYSASLALEAAERQIREQLTPQAQERMTDSFVDELRNKAVVK